MTEKKQKLNNIRLYALLTETHCHHGWKWTARELIRGGVDAIQLREKELPDSVVISRARKLRELTRGTDCILIINDRPDIALLCEADGVHLGQDDLAPEEIRELVGEEMIIGLSTHNSEQAQQAAQRGADYAAVGPVFATSTKGYDRGGGAEFVQQLCAQTDLPTVAIGGITPDSAPQIIEAGAHAVAACQALCSAQDPREAAQSFLEFRAESGEVE